MTLATVRDDLKTALEASLADSVTVYSYPAEAVAMPAVVIVPASPWWRPYRLRGADMAGVQVNFELQLLVTRGEVEESFKALEGLAIAVGAVLVTGKVYKWIELNAPEPVQINKVDALIATMTIATVT